MNAYEDVQKYISWGWVVHPLSNPKDNGKSPGKRPLITEWQNLDRTPDNIGAYIKDGCNIGLVCGKVSNVDAFDIDLPYFTDDLFNGVKIETLTSGHRDGRGHLLFKHEDDLIADKKHFIGIEYFGTNKSGGGTNLVLPPSVHVSGEVYKWKSPDVPIIKMPERLKKNWKDLMRKEDALKAIFKKCRPCFFKTLWDNPDDIAIHNKNGRDAVLAIMGELKANGCTNELLHVACKRFFGKDYKYQDTEKELQYIQPIHPKCETLRQHLNVDCMVCKYKQEGSASSYKNNGAFEYIQRIKEKNPIYFDKTGQFWIWNDCGYYEQIDNTEVLLVLLKNIADPSIIQSKFKAELLTAAQLVGRDAKVKPLPNNWIHIQNGVYDIKTGELFEATPDYLFTEPIPHKLSGSEDTPTIDKLFSEWVVPDKVQLLYEIAAYCLYNGYPIHRMFVLLGRGRNGKGQYRDLIVNLVGHQNRSASTLEQLINSRFETARLYNKKICTMGEINYALLDRTAILKMLSGGDPIPGEQKNKQPFEFVNTAKLLINTNSLPQTSDKTDAFYSRCIVVEFGRQFLIGKDIIDTIPQAEYDNLLTKCLRILRELLDRGQFTNEGDIQDKEREYEKLSNPLKMFINTYYESDVNGKIAAWRMFDEYIIFCDKHGFKKPHSKNEFNDMLRIDYEVEKKNLVDDETETNVCWIWIFGFKKRTQSVLSNLSEVPLYTPHKESYGVLDKSDKTDKTAINQPNPNPIKVSYNSTQFLDKNTVTEINTVTELKPTFTDFGVRAKDWICYNSKAITKETLTEASMWIAESVKARPSDVKTYLIREYAIVTDS